MTHLPHNVLIITESCVIRMCLSTEHYCLRFLILCFTVPLLPLRTTLLLLFIIIILSSFFVHVHVRLLVVPEQFLHYRNEVCFLFSTLASLLELSLLFFANEVTIYLEHLQPSLLFDVRFS